MNTETIIRDIATDFLSRFINHFDADYPEKYNNVVEALQEKMLKLYKPESKMYFLDEVKLGCNQAIVEHKRTCRSQENCDTLRQFEKIRFFIQQEIDALPHIIRGGTTNELRNKVFISYSHIDKPYLDQLKRHFKPFQNKVDFWDDSRILPGATWKKEIEMAMSEAKIAILLLSADFFNSDFILEKELPSLLKAAQDEGATILSVILKPCLFSEYPEISQYQAINAPSFAIIQMDEAQREMTWVSLVKQVKKILDL